MGAAPELPLELLVQLEMAGQDTTPIHALSDRLRTSHARAYDVRPDTTRQSQSFPFRHCIVPRDYPRRPSCDSS
jgi:hypothetical protein